MENKLLDLEIKQIVKRIVLALFFSISFVALSLTNHFLFLDRPDRGVSHSDNVMILIVFCSLTVIFWICYVLNLFFFKNKKAYLLMNSISDGATIFCLISIILILIVSQEKIVFNKEHLSLLISSSFTLLGFGLTIMAILVTYVVKRIKCSNSEERNEIIFAHLLPYFLFFGMGLLYTLCALLELQFVDTGYYKIVVYKSLFYSIVQIFFLFFKIIEIVFRPISNSSQGQV